MFTVVAFFLENKKKGENTTVVFLWRIRLLSKKLEVKMSGVEGEAVVEIKPVKF